LLNALSFNAFSGSSPYRPGMHCLLDPQPLITNIVAGVPAA
jgi:hypothetical protein